MCGGDHACPFSHPRPSCPSPLPASRIAREGAKRCRMAARRTGFFAESAQRATRIHLPAAFIPTAYGGCGAQAASGCVHCFRTHEKSASRMAVRSIREAPTSLRFVSAVCIHLSRAAAASTTEPVRMETAASSSISCAYSPPSSSSARAISPPNTIAPSGCRCVLSVWPSG